MPLSTTHSTAARMRGFSLIELMIALVVGLIVSGAAVALVVSIMKSNAQTIRATRLTQELRVTAEIVSREMRRARSVTDPIANVGIVPANLLQACNTITPANGASANCATFGYDCSSATNATFKAIGLVTGGKVRLASSTAAVPACPTTGTGTQLSSDTINISDLTICGGVFNSAGSCASGTTDMYSIRLTGSFNNDPDGLVRTITQEVRIRSSAVN